MVSAILAARHRTFVLVVNVTICTVFFSMHNYFLLLLLNTVKQLGFEGLSEDVDGDGWVAKLPRKCVPRRWAR